MKARGLKQGALVVLLGIGMVLGVGLLSGME